MFNLIRRISSTVLPRRDRTWDDEATSTAPQKGRKRLLSTTDDDESVQNAKRARGDADEEGDGESDTSQRDETPTLAVKETEEVKEVRVGVSEVEITDLSTDATDVSLEKSVAVPRPESQISGEEEGEVPAAEPANEKTLVTKEGETSEGADANVKDVDEPSVSPASPEKVASNSTTKTPASNTASPATMITEATENPKTVEQEDSTQESLNGRKSKRAPKPRSV